MDRVSAINIYYYYYNKLKVKSLQLCYTLKVLESYLSIYF